jgi:hypothetical protein
MHVKAASFDFQLITDILQLRISYRSIDIDAAQLAKRLFIRASLEVSINICVRTAALIPILASY